MRMLLICAAIMLASITACRSKSADAPPHIATEVPTASDEQAAPNVPPGIDPAQTSDDPSYGYTPGNPVRVGFEDEFSGPAASQVYLRHLRDAKFGRFEFERVGSFGGNPDEHLVDKYILRSSTGEKFEIFIDMYHPECTPLRQLAPKGMYFWK